MSPPRLEEDRAFEGGIDTAATASVTASATVKIDDMINQQLQNPTVYSNAAPASSASSPPVAPNSEPRETLPDEDTYVYRDFGTIPAPSVGGAALHPQSLQAQKLPAKLASMLSDQELAGVCMWLPHGRSWRVLNRDVFAEHALPRYFGHKNYASFVRIVNAWGFRRITRGPDRDSYYHELFLRGRPDLHQRMKRLSTCHRKTPVHKEDKCPDFYELAKTSPLPQAGPQIRANQGAMGMAGLGGMNPNSQLAQAAQLSNLAPLRHGMPGSTVASMGSLGGPMGNINEQVLSMLTNNAASRSMPMNPGLPASMAQGGAAAPQLSSQLPRLAQLQRDNEDLRRRIMEMENKQAQRQGGAGLGGNGVVPDQLAALSAANINMMGNGGTGGTNLLNGTGGTNLLQPSGAGVNSQNEFSFMTGFPRDEMLLRAMRLENQMGHRQPPSSSNTSSASSTLERALQLQQQQNRSPVVHHSNTPPGVAGGVGGVGGVFPAPGGIAQSEGDRKKAMMMDWLSKQQQGPV